MNIEYCDVYHTLQGYLDNVKVCELNIFVENEDCDNDNYKEPRYWLNGIYTTFSYERKGYATQLIKEAINKYGEIYISKASEYEHKQRGDNTARQLTEDGAALVNKLKDRGVLKTEWFINPFL